MSSSLFTTQEHSLPCCHIRQYPLATADSQEDVLHLAIKQYTPKDNASPQPGDVTIIGAHANGFPKELYEPLWDELYQRLKTNGIRIRSIWIADVAHQGQSSVLNEDKLGNDPSWFDHPRDLLSMINHFRSEMTRPMVGVGHSMGGAHLTTLALIHPRLFSTLILLDPVIQRVPNPAGNWAPAVASTRRRDLWPSREEARASFLKSKFYQAWDPRVLDIWIEHGLRDLPTKIYPSTGSKQVTLTTTKHQEVSTFMRGNIPCELNPNPATEPNLLTHPDVDLSHESVTPFYRPEAMMIFAQLPYLRPSVFYVFGSKSNLSDPDLCADKMAVTGVGVGGNGGAQKGRVKEVVLDAGHLIPMEKVTETADHCSAWLVQELSRFRDEETIIENMRQAIPREKRSQMTDEFVQSATGDFLKKLQRSKL